MRRVRVALDAGGREAEIHPMYDLLANAEFVERATAMHWTTTGEEQTFLHYVEGDADAFRTATAEASAVVDAEVVPAGEGAFYAFVRGESTEPLRELFGAVDDVAVIPIPPVQYHPDGSVSVTIVGPADDVQAAVESIPAPVEVSIEEVGGVEATPGLAETLLADRQREALAAALELGYYELPREASHEDVAEAIGCAPSTAAEHLRKAEAKVLERIVIGGGERGI